MEYGIRKLSIFRDSSKSKYMQSAILEGVGACSEKLSKGFEKGRQI
jgi:hypothetical protein